MTWNARWFNGRDSTVHAAEVDVADGQLRVRLADAADPEPSWHVFPVPEASISERYPDAARKLQLPDGSTLAVVDDPEGGFDFALRQQGYRPGIAAFLIQAWPVAVACTLALMALLVWMDRQGAGWLASIAVPVVPISVDQRLGAAAGAILEKSWMTPSEIPDVRQQRLAGRVKEMIDEQYPELVWALAFRNMRNQADAFNALTLPGGTIVLLDGLTVELTDDQVVAVVGHELGHVVHRHTMQRLLRQVGLLAIAGVVLGDVSGLAAGAMAGYQDLHYSRDAEREADAFALEFLRRGGLSARHMAGAFEAMRSQSSSGSLPAFLSSHPPTDERLRLAQEAASK